MADAVNSISAPIATFPSVYPRFMQADPIPGLARRPMLRTSTYDAAEQAAAMNAVLVALNAMLAEGGACA